MLNTQYSLQTLLNATDMNTAHSSSVCNIKNLIGYSLQHVWTAGSVSRAVTVELTCSNTEDGTFTVVDSYDVDGNSGDRLINVEFPRYNFVKIITSVGSAGGGTLTTNLSGRSL